MKVKKVETVYVCVRKECGSPLMSSRLANDELDSILDNIEVKNQCYACRQDTMQLTRVVIHLQSPLYYGDARFGLWRCPNHTTMNYYPKLLQNAIESGDYNTLQYKIISDKGRPFKCPICETELLYMDERILACAYC